MEFRSNTGLEYRGTNIGTCEHNTFCRVSGSENKLHLLENTNGRFRGEENNLDVKSTVNCTFSGIQNVVKSGKDVNLSLSGNGNKCTFSRNTNSTISGNRNKTTLENATNFTISGNLNNVQLSGDTNGKIEGDSNYVVTSKNVNLSVVGNSNHLELVSGTKNHTFKVLQTGDTTNKLRIVFHPREAAISNGVVFISSTFSCNGNTSGISSFGPMLGIGNTSTVRTPPQIWIEYTKEASVSGSTYKLGLLKFDLKEEKTQEGVQRMNAIFNPVNYDTGTLEAVRAEAGIKLTVKGAKAGQIQTLEFSAPGITHVTAVNGQITVQMDSMKTENATESQSQISANS